MAAVEKETKKTKRQSNLANTVEDDNNYMINLAVKLAEKQLREGTASSQVMVHYLKLGSEREKLEVEKLKQENNLLKTKIKEIETRENTEQLYRDAIAAMRRYGGQGSGDA